MKTLSDALLDLVSGVSPETLGPFFPFAREALSHIDSKDVDYLACALAVDADAIWSSDRHFDQQSLVPRVERLPR